MSRAMNGALVIAKKDLKNIFMSPLFYTVAGICSFIWWLLFVKSLGQFVQMSLRQSMMAQIGSEEGAAPLHYAVIWPHFSVVNLIMIFAVSALTMRLFTEEKRNRTFDLLLTSPVTSTEIVLGKLVAGVGTAWALLAVGALYPLSLAFFGSLDWGPFLSSLLGLMLLVAGYVAIGIFASSLTQSAVIAVISTLILNVMLWFLGVVAEMSGDPTQKSFFEHLNVGTHLMDFMKGNLSVAAFAFFVSLIFLFTFLTRQVVESTRWRA